jgi:hypothetical protein
MEDILDAKHCKRIQQVVIIYSLVMLLVFLYFLLFQYTKYMLLLFLIASTVTVALNYYFAKFYGIRMEDKTIVFENMWRKMQYPTSELKDIRLVRFMIPYPLNPYLNLN